MKFDALYIGRFQPFHKGHLYALRQILDENDEVLIAIGSANKPVSLQNPLTYPERAIMIEELMLDEHISSHKYVILPLSDIDNDEKWVKHVRRILPDFKKVYTGSEHTKRLFEEDGRHKVVDIKILPGVSATAVREQYLNGDDAAELIPTKVKDFLKKIDFAGRLKMLS